MKYTSLVRGCFVFLLVGFIFLALSDTTLWAQAQNTSQIQGTVTDATGQLFPALR